jgi:hypothetical protein
MHQAINRLAMVHGFGLLGSLFLRIVAAKNQKKQLPLPSTLWHSISQ